MRLKEITAITGMSGLYKIETQKLSGIIVTSLIEGWTKFISNRQNIFSPLENISVYTDDENVDLADVFIAISEQPDLSMPADPKVTNDELKEWFGKIIPNFDREKVHISDIKKIIKWYAILSEKGVVQTEIEEKAKKAEEKTTAENELPQDSEKVEEETTISNEEQEEQPKTVKKMARKETSKTDETGEIKPKKTKTASDKSGTAESSETKSKKNKENTGDGKLAE